MKKTFSLFIAAMMLPLAMTAQARIALVNSQDIFNAMPEKAAAEAQLQKLSDEYRAEHLQMQEEFDKKYAEFQALDDTTPSAIRERRIQELQQSDDEIRQFEERAAADLARQRESLTKPLTDRVQQAINDVGREGGYDLIFDVSVTPVAYSGGTTSDVTPQVKARVLGQ